MTGYNNQPKFRPAESTATVDEGMQKDANLCQKFVFRRVSARPRGIPLAAALSLVVVSSASVWTAASAASPPIWVTPRATSGASGFVPDALPAELTVAWETKTSEAIETTPAVSETAVFVADVMGGVEALDRQTGRSLWRRELDTGFVASPTLLCPATITDDRFGFPILRSDKAVVGDEQRLEIARSIAAATGTQLILGDVEGNVWALNTATGETTWKQAVDGEISATPTLFALISDDDTASTRLLVTSQDGNLRCLSADDGELLWTYETGDQIRCGASIGDGKTYLGGCDGALHVVDLTTGTSVGEPLPLGGPTGSTPALQGGDVFVPIMGGVVYKFAAGQTSPAWQYEDADIQHEYRGDAAVADDRVVIASRSKQVLAIDRQSGQRLWETTLRRRPDASPIIAGQDVWIAGSDGTLSRLSLADGTTTWSFESRGAFLAAPAIVDSRLIIADDDGVVRCFAAPEPRDSPDSISKRPE